MGSGSSKTINVVLADGAEYAIPRVSPFAAPDGLREKLRFLQDQLQGTAFLRIQRKVERAVVNLQRIQKSIERIDEYILADPNLTLDQKKEWLEKIESLDSKADLAHDQVDRAQDEMIGLRKNIVEYAEVAAIYVLTLPPNSLSEEVAQGLISVENQEAVVQAMFGITPSKDEEDDDEDGPLDSIEKKPSGPDGSASAAE